MSLFNRQKKRNKVDPPKNDMSKKQTKYDIICPYCFSKFDPEDALFRAEKSEGIEYIFDKKLDDFWTLINTENRASALPIIDPGTLNEKYKTRVPQRSSPEEGVIVELETEYGKTTTRICPDCHNTLPKTAGRSPSNIISVVGDTNVGKTVFLTVLIETLCNKTQCNFNASAMVIVNKEEFYSMRDELYKNNNLLGSTDKKYQKPLVFNWGWVDPSVPDITISFFDFPGEAIDNEEFHRIQGNHIKNASGIILLLDPTQVEEIAKKTGHDLNEKTGHNLNEKTASSPDKKPRRRNLSDGITNLWENAFHVREDGRETTPTAVVITKSDILKKLSTIDPAILPGNSNIFIDYKHENYLNLDEVDNIHYDVQGLLAHYEQPVINNIKRHFTDHCFFAVSSLGYDPLKDNKDNESSANNKDNESSVNNVESIISPSRIDEPFLWLLYKLGFIEGR